MSGQGRPDRGGTPRLLRAHNERTLLEHLRRAGPSSRPDLARIAGLSKPTVSQALANLESAGLVRPVGPASPSLGRTAMLYEVDPTAGYVVGIDIGRAWIRVAAADLSGGIVARRDERNRARGAAVTRLARLPPGGRGGRPSVADQRLAAAKRGAVSCCVR